MGRENQQGFSNHQVGMRMWVGFWVTPLTDAALLSEGGLCRVYRT